jgi:hypothetical protein
MIELRQSTTLEKNMEGKRKALIIDIDDTLSDASHRREYLKGYTKDFEKFFSEMELDGVNPHIKALCDMFDGEIILLTGRPDSYKEVTEKWLKKHDIKYDFLFMKPVKDKYVKDFVFKESFYLSDIAPKFKIIHAIDDRKVVIDMWREIGVPVSHEHTFRNKSTEELKEWLNFYSE